MLLGLAILLVLGIVLIFHGLGRRQNWEGKWIPYVVIGGILIAVSLFLLAAAFLLIWGVD